MGWDHTGPCETVCAKPLMLTEQERGWRRFARIVDDWSFAIMWAAQSQKERKESE